MNGFKFLRLAVLALVMGAAGFGVSAPLAHAQAQPEPNARGELVEYEPRWRHLTVLEALDRSGYRVLSVRETLLNRVRIRAENDFHLREIVISRSSGAILRDVSIETYSIPARDLQTRMDVLPPLGIPLENIDPDLLPQ